MPLKEYHLGNFRTRTKTKTLKKEIDRLLDIRADRDSTKGAIIESLIERGRFAMNPPPDALAILGNRFAFTFTLGLNASSAIVNLSQIPLVMAPMLGGRFGYLKASKAFINAARFYTNSGFSNKIRLSKRVKGSVYKDVAAAPSILINLVPSLSDKPVNILEL